MRNVHILCSNCPLPATTQARSVLPPSNGFVDNTQLNPLVNNCVLVACGHPILDLYTGYCTVPKML